MMNSSGKILDQAEKNFFTNSIASFSSQTLLDTDFVAGLMSISGSSDRVVTSFRMGSMQMR